MKKEGRHASHYQQYYWKKGEAEYGKQKKTSKKMVLHSNCMYAVSYTHLIDGDRLYSHFSARTDDTHSDFTPVGNQYLVKHQLLSPIQS